MLKCTKCGADIGNAEVYCPICGALRPPPPPGMKCCSKCQNYIPKAVKICPVCKSNQRGVLSCSGMLGALLFLIALPFVISALANIMAGYQAAKDSTTAVTTSPESLPPAVTTVTIAEQDTSVQVNQDILNKLEKVAKENIENNYEVKYWDSMNAYSISCWVDGLSNIVAAGEYIPEWESMVIAAAATSSLGAQEIREIDPSANLCFIVCNEMNTDNMFVLTMNGEVLYDILDPNLEHYK